MTNTAKLNEVIRSSGLDKSIIAERLGISCDSFSKKVNGHRQFRVSEISKMRDMLNLSGTDLTDIFFS